MTTETKKKRRLLADVRVGGSGMDTDALRTMAERNPEQFMERMQDLIDKGELSWAKVRSLPNLFNALADVSVPARMLLAGQERAIQASAFPLLTGALTIAGLNEAYDELPVIGDQLVTEMEDNKRVSVFASLTAEDTNIEEVKEGKDFPEIGAGEEKYEIRSKRNGRRLSITAEAIEENDVAGIIQKINKLAEIANNFVEKQTLRRVCDIDGSAASPAEPYVLRPNGAGTSLFTTSNATLTRLPSTGNRVTSNALVDTTDLDAARARLTAMRTDLGDRVSIPVSGCTLLVPDALVGVASKIQGSELEPGTENELNNWGPRGQWRPRLLSSPRLDDLSTTAWYFGAPKKQFIRKWKLRYEYMTLGQDTESFLRSRLAAQARIAWDCEIGAVDYVYWIQNLSATAAPTP